MAHSFSECLLLSVCNVAGILGSSSSCRLSTSHQVFHGLAPLPSQMKLSSFWDNQKVQMEIKTNQNNSSAPLGYWNFLLHLINPISGLCPCGPLPAVVGPNSTSLCPPHPYSAPCEFLSIGESGLLCCVSLHYPFPGPATRINSVPSAFLSLPPGPARETDRGYSLSSQSSAFKWALFQLSFSSLQFGSVTNSITASWDH